MMRIEFVVPGVPVPYVRTTVRQKFVSKQYKRYRDYQEQVRAAYMLARLKSRSKSSDRVEPMEIMSSKEYLMPSTGTLMRMTECAKKVDLGLQTTKDFVRVSLFFDEYA